MLAAGQMFLVVLACLDSLSNADYAESICKGARKSGQRKKHGNQLWFSPVTNLHVYDASGKLRKYEMEVDIFVNCEWATIDVCTLLADDGKFTVDITEVSRLPKMTELFRQNALSREPCILSCWIADIPEVRCGNPTLIRLLATINHRYIGGYWTT